PVTGLDPKAQADLYEMIGKLNSECVTIIMVSHDVGAAMRYASHILHIGSHKQLFFGTAEDYAKSSVGRTFIASEEAENDD
ncbi:MAG: ABC transporter, partial [Ruminococcus sp.]|nr:ABC transporter [Ruminococcus sp.]